MKAIEATETVRPTRSQMNLDVGRISFQESLQLFGLVVGSLAASAIASLVTNWVGPHEIETWGTIGGWRISLTMFTGLITLFGVTFSGVVFTLFTRSWLNYERRLMEWHTASLSAVEEQPVERERVMRVWDLSSSQLPHVLAVAVAVHARTRAGETSAHTVRQLAGDVWLGSHRLGDVPQAEAESFGSLFDRLGLVEGRGNRKAGKWLPESTDQVVELVCKNWGAATTRA